MAGYAFGSNPPYGSATSAVVPASEPGPITRGGHWTQKFLPSCRIVRTRRMGPGSEAGASMLCCLADSTNQPAGQITKNLSSPSRKNIPLNASGKSPLQARPVPPETGADRESSRTRGGTRWTRQRRLAQGVAGRDFPV